MKKLGKVLLVLLLSVFFVTLIFANSFNSFGEGNIWTGKVATDFKGEGTKENPYVITLAEELALLSRNVRYGNSYDGCYFELGADIILNDSSNWQEWGTINENGEVIAPANTWTPIGLYDNYGFEGNFDGKNHTVSGMYVNNVEGKHFGLFGYANNYYVNVKNLYVKESFVYGKNTETNNYYDAKVGGVVGYGNVDNCHFSGTVIGDAGHTYIINVGGVLGYGSATNCTAYGKVSAVEVEHITSYVGGIVGNSVFDENFNCKNYAEVRGTTVGGIVGNGNASYCENYGSLYAKGDKIGGISGYGRTVYSKNEGDINAELCDFVGGVTGDANAFNASNEDVIYYCFNSGKITAENCVDVGGVAAVGIVRESYNAGDIDANGCTTVAGILASTGEDSSYTTGKCYNVGEINAEGCVNVCATVGTNENNNVVGTLYYLDTFESEDKYGTKLTASQMKSKSNFSGYNFNKDWEFVEDAEYPYPTLRYFGSKIYGYGVDLYDGNNLIESNTVVENTPYIFKKLSDKDGLKFYGYECDGKHYFAGDSILVEKDTTINVIWQAVNTGDNVWDGSADTEWQGSGSQDDPYLITDAAELAGITALVNLGEDFRDKYFSLENDIRLNSSFDFGYFLVAENQWDPIGNYVDVMEGSHVICTPEFKGNFNGNGHTIYGLYINSNNEYLGLFGNASESSFENIIIKDSYVCIRPGNYSYTYVGSLAGYARNVKNCISYAKVEFAARGKQPHNYEYDLFVGGVTGKATNVSDCENYGSMALLGQKGSYIYTSSLKMAGITGYAYLIDNCKNYGSLTAKDFRVDGHFSGFYMSGICSDASTVSNCENHGEINVPSIQESSAIDESVYLSGICRYASTVTDCVNFAVIKGSGESTGIVSRANTIENCINKAKLYGREVYGICEDAEKILGCSNIADLTARGSYLGVIASGICNEAEYIADCENSGNIDAYFDNEHSDYGENFASGIAINLYGEEYSNERFAIERCKNTGNIKLEAKYIEKISISGSAGIIVSATGKHEVDQCYNGGKIYNRGLSSIDIHDNYCGGIAGRADVTNCYNTAPIEVVVRNIDDTYAVGGIVGEGSAQNCYNIGSINVNALNGYDDISVGGVVGISNNKATENSYYLKAKNYGEAVYNDLGIAKTDAELKLKTTFNRYDFNKFWEMGGVSDFSYPNLRFLGSGTYKYFITVKDFGKTVSTEMYYGSSVLTFEAPLAKSGYRFAYFENEQGQFEVGDTFVVKEDTTFTAVWTKLNKDDAWDGNTDTSFEGSGTEEDPYLISSAAELSGLATLINENRNSEYASAYYKQTSDIYINSPYEFSSTVIAENSWTPIGKDSYNHKFSGNYDGNGFTVFGLFIKDNSQYKGLFSCANDATFKNITLKNGCLVHTNEKNVGAYMGALVARGERITLDNIVNYVDVTSMKRDDTAGGIVGTSLGLTSNNCKNYGDVSAYRVGSLIGYLESEDDEEINISGCENYATVKSNEIDYGVVGGIIGEADFNWCSDYFEAKVYNCFNEGEIYCKRGYAGGIIGTSNGNLKLYNCENKGFVHGSCPSGIISRVNSDYYSTISDCVNRGRIVCEVKEDGTVYSMAAGIVGMTEYGAYVDITKCENYAKIESCNTAGGIAGSVISAYILECNNHGEIKINKQENSYSSYVGGIAAISESSISKCTNNANLYGNDYVGGIAGEGASIYNCINNGNIMGETVGGIVAKIEPNNYYANCLTQNCINYGEVVADNTAGGIAGNVRGNYSTISLCENYGNVVLNEGGYVVGGIVGSIDGNVNKCCNIANVTNMGYGNTGGIAGDGKVSLSYNKGDVTGYNYVGGISGRGTAIDCFSVCSVNGNNYVSGIVSYGNAENCYALGSVSGNNYVYTICEGTALNCYYKNTVTTKNEYYEPVFNGTYITYEDLKAGNMEGFDFETVWQTSVDEEYDYPTLRDTAYYSTRTVKFLDSDGETVLKEQKVRIGGNAYPPTIEPTTDENYVYAIDHWEGEYKNVQNNVTVKAVYKKTEKIKFMGRTFEINVPFGFSKDNLSAKIESEYGNIIANTTHGYKIKLETGFDISSYELDKSGTFTFIGNALITESPYYEMADGEKFAVKVTVNPALNNEFDVSDLILEENNGTLTVTGYNGTAQEIRIPEKINGKKVVGIGANAFKDNENITGVYLPDSIEVIEDGAFMNAVNLVSVAFSDNLKEIGANAFYNTSLSGVTLSKTLETIGENAFGIFENETVKEFTVYCERESIAETYAKENGLGIVYFEVATNETTGISVNVAEGLTLNASRIVGGDYYETAQTISEKANVSLFEITLSSETEAEVQPDNMLKISIPLPDGYGNDAKIYRINSDGSYLDMNAVLVDGKLVFNTAHLSFYAIISEDDKIIGDCNGDGLFDTTDLAEMKLYLAGLNEMLYGNGDVNDDGKVDTTDLAEVKLMLAGLA